MNILRYGDENAKNILVQLVDEHDLAQIDEEIDKISELSCEKFLLITVKVEDWNLDLSPWKAPAVFGNQDFGDGAENTLDYVLNNVVKPLKNEKREDVKFFIGGYSLAGLFALWSAYKTDEFFGVAAASPSVWFPDFLEFAKSGVPLAKCVYLSLGDKEERTKNKVMQTVGDNIREISQDLENKCVVSALEWNDGGHFKDFALRTAKGFAWMLNKV